MSQISLAELSVIACPEDACIRKTRRFKNVDGLNSHLKLVHRSDYKITIDGKGCAHRRAR